MSCFHNFYCCVKLFVISVLMSGKFDFWQSNSNDMKEILFLVGSIENFTIIIKLMKSNLVVFFQLFYSWLWLLTKCFNKKNRKAIKRHISLVLALATNGREANEPHIKLMLIIKFTLLYICVLRYVFTWIPSLCWAHKIFVNTVMVSCIINGWHMENFY